MIYGYDGDDTIYGENDDDYIYCGGDPADHAEGGAGANDNFTGCATAIQ